MPRRLLATLPLVAILATSACGAHAPAGGGAGVASEAEWRSLSAPRPDPLPGAARVTVSSVDFLGSFPWPEAVRVGPELGVSELVVANLLRRRDVRFVERRRFSAAAEAVRRGDPAPPGRPVPGVSRSVDFGIGVAWLPTSADQVSVEIRMVRFETGEVETATRFVLPRDSGPVSLARAVVDGALDALRGLDRLPEWLDPDARVNVTDGGRVSTEALRHFLRGLAAEETWNWEGARRGYQQALAVDPDFHEARTALERAARLRLGGTLAES